MLTSHSSLYEAISLSINTIAERVTELATNINDQIKDKVNSFERFSIACDESTDIGGVAQLTIFFFVLVIRILIYEKLLELVPMLDTTIGQDIFTAVFEVLSNYKLPLSKLVSVATDGTPCMTGKNNGFVSLLQKKLEYLNFPKIHHTNCIIHQEVLCAKAIKMDNVLSFVKKAVNFIRSRELNQRQFAFF